MGHSEIVEAISYVEAAADVVRNAKAAATRSVNLAMTYAYFEVGRIVVEEEQEGGSRAKYGNQVIANVSTRLTEEFGRGFSMTNVEQMRKFYRVYSTDEIPQKVSEEFGASLPVTTTGRKFFLSWSHYLKLMRMDDESKRHFYEIEAARNGWSLKELQRQFDSGLYERLALSRDKEGVRLLSEEGQIFEGPSDAIKDPYVLEFLGLKEKDKYSETELETRIIDHLQEFLLELGRGFAFVGRQQRFTYEEDHFKVDLVFYNRLLRCFVLFDLKLGKLTHQDIGQMQMYIHYYDRMVKLNEENPTIGVLLCQDKNDAVVEMTLPKDNEQVFASKYKTVLPSTEELKGFLVKEGDGE
ncbi:YhcG family protein [Adlercreutzia sp. ZJ138]|uniref:PDDEXK nuclease domain-containing protein n=1 Tax=Adlercreutzia sp. ZJ138 TaxID=2709405 RepID=UPI0013EA1919|nr:PDDEXK nuclease domain-containing protein [Adlercreutzia sp. ZJ138]